MILSSSSVKPCQVGQFDRLAVLGQHIEHPAGIVVHAPSAPQARSSVPAAVPSDPRSRRAGASSARCGSLCTSSKPRRASTSSGCSGSGGGSVSDMLLGSSPRRSGTVPERSRERAHERRRHPAPALARLRAGATGCSGGADGRDGATRTAERSAPRSVADRRALRGERHGPRLRLHPAPGDRRRRRVRADRGEISGSPHPGPRLRPARVG